MYPINLDKESDENSMRQISQIAGLAFDTCLHARLSSTGWLRFFLQSVFKLCCAQSRIVKAMVWPGILFMERLSDPCAND